MIKINKSYALLFLSLLLGSFSDEAAQTIFALTLSNVDQIYLTALLLMLGMVGGIIANTFFSQITQKIGIKTLIFSCLMGEALLIIICIVYIFKNTLPVYCPLVRHFGRNAVVWGVPLLSKNDAELNRLNKYTHLIRNVGFMIGPAIGGAMAAFSSYQHALLLVGASTLLSARVIIKIAFRTTPSPPRPAKKAMNGFAAIPHLLKVKKIRYVLSPLAFTILSTSTLSVLAIVYLVDIIKLNAEQYGLYSALFSLSLAVAPLALTKPLSALGEARAACLAATGIGIGLLLLSMTENYPLVLCCGIFTAAFNGTQNTIMSAFMLKHIPSEQRENYMPAYILILQLCVLSGFILAMGINAQDVTLAFQSLGAIAIISGVVGMVINKR